MLGTLGIVQVRMRGDAQPDMLRTAACASRRFGEKSMLEWIVRRVTDAQRLDGVIAMIDQGPCAATLADLVPPDVPVFVNRQPDPLAGLVAALRSYRAAGVVMISIDNPFIDPALIDRLVTTADTHRYCDYISYRSAAGSAAVLSQVGVLAEWCRAEAIMRADREATDPAERCDIARHLYSHPENYQLRLIPAPAGLDRDDVRLTVNSADDWEHAQAIYEALGPESLDYRQIADLLNHQPALRERMAVLNRAEA